MTVDLNLTNAEFIQFYFMYGCMIPPSNRNQGVLLEYSLNGGINWHLLTEIFYDLYTKPGWVLGQGGGIHPGKQTSENDSFCLVLLFSGL